MIRVLPAKTASACSLPDASRPNVPGMWCGPSAVQSLTVIAALGAATAALKRGDKAERGADKESGFRAGSRVSLAQRMGELECTPHRRSVQARRLNASSSVG